MNYSLLSIFFGSRSRTDASDSRTGTYLQELLISFLVFFSNFWAYARPRFHDSERESNSRCKPAAVACGLPVDVLRTGGGGGGGHFTNSSQFPFFLFFLLLLLFLLKNETDLSIEIARRISGFSNPVYVLASC